MTEHQRLITDSFPEHAMMEVRPGTYVRRMTALQCEHLLTVPALAYVS